MIALLNILKFLPIISLVSFVSLSVIFNLPPRPGCAPQLRCQFSHLRCENRTCEVQNAAAISKRICDFKTHLRPPLRRCDFKTQMQRSCCVWKTTGCDSSNQNGNSLRGFITNITDLMVYLFLFLFFLRYIYIYIVCVHLIHPFTAVPKKYL